MHRQRAADVRVLSGYITLTSEDVMSRLVSELRAREPLILPSMLLCDFSNLEREVRALEAAGADAFHLDVMDGVFVPQLTYGPPLVAAFRKLTRLPLDVHLMIQRPDRYLAAFCAAGADIVTVHVESLEDPASTLQRIRSLGAAAGATLNPDTPLARLEPCLPHCDLVLVMSVQAGFGGQSFQPGALPRLRELRTSLPAEAALEVDGGVNKETIRSCAQAGAGWHVVGSGIFRADDFATAIEDLRRQIS